MIVEKRIPILFIFNKIKYDLFFVVFTVLLIQLNKIWFADSLPKIPISIPVFFGTSISILLSFKVNQSYERWWEARKIWGSIVNDSRSLVLQLQTFLPLENHIAVTKKIAFRQIAWCYSLGQSLRGLNPLENTHSFLSDFDVEKLKNQDNKPLGILQLNAMDIKFLKEKNEIDGFTHLQIDNTFVRLCDSMGKAERINNTVFPTTYRLFLRVAIYLFVIILSFALKEISLMLEILLLSSISTVFFLLEKTAYHLQDPFRNRPSDTAVTAIARTIEINIKQMLGEKITPKPLEPNGFYIM
jgi:ion channel-forming bestrophin family protein